MNNQFNKGLAHSFLGSFLWGFIGVIYFKYISFIGTEGSVKFNFMPNFDCTL